MKKVTITFFFFIISILASPKVYGSHIRAGEITAVRTSSTSLSYIFTCVGYEVTSIPISFGDGTVNFGDGTESPLSDIAISVIREDLPNNTTKVTYTFKHTFKDAQEYLISYTAFNRNGGILTMDNSINTAFYIETTINVDPIFGLNHTPVLLIPPIDIAASGVKFIHNPGAYDVEGDSLSYKIIENKMEMNTSVDGFKFPNDPSLYEGMDYNTANEAGNDPPTFAINPVTGDLIWDAPGMEGEYNLAIVVEEWRKIDGEWHFLSKITRDMQVLVESTDNNPPKLIVPNDTCIVAGSLLAKQIFADDPDGHQVKIETFSGAYGLAVSPATYSPNPSVFMPVPALMEFEWLTNGSHVIERPYQVQFRTTDEPPLGPALTDYKTWNITVNGPEPENLVAELIPGRQVALTWDGYSYKDEAHKMQVWRRVASFDFEKESCQTGVPDFAGYEKVGEVEIDDVAFLDDNGGKGLAPGASYCYRLVAVWPQPEGGESYASEEVCVEMEALVPIITNVSVENTSETSGEILVKWAFPFDINPVFFPPPYTYGIIRATGINGNEEMVAVASVNDTTFTDTGLNTADKFYNYRIVLYDVNNQMVDTSAVASSVGLQAEPLTDGIKLTWKAEVPWSNNLQQSPFHFIYRNDGEGGVLQLIDSVHVNSNGFLYVDKGQYNGIELSNTKEYCYFIETQGSYGNPKIISPLKNKSQAVCVYPNDTIAPCAPSVSIDIENSQDCLDFLADKDCSFTDYSNTLTWNETAEGCGEDIKRYNVYFSPSGEDGTFSLISPDNLTETHFQHTNIFSLAGCYKVTSVDHSGNESQFSETICSDNCPQYALPNVITPNDDGFNDTFFPMGCIRFVESVRFKVMNRWGKEVYHFSSNGDDTLYINWDGKTNQKKDLPTGIYYHETVVKFIRLSPADAVQTYKGWVQILR